MTNELAVAEKAVQSEAKQISDWQYDAMAIVITGQPEYDKANALLNAVVTKKKALNERRMEITRPLDEAKASIMDLFRKPVDALTEVETTLRDTMSAYLTELDRQRQAQLRAQQEAAAAAARELEAASASAEPEQVAEVIERAVAAVPAPIAAAPKGSGRKTYAAEVYDKMMLIKAVAAGTVPHTALAVDQKALDKVASALGEAMNYPGVRVISGVRATRSSR